ncbi:MAG TPA: DUF5615 family PIN-like protein [Chloroflexota bacterium]|nr:DUF5615 family PIN-like protein [Chloroflexota bacterium]
MTGSAEASRLRLLADEDFSGTVLRGLRVRDPDADVITVHQAGLTGRDDGAVLEWAAREGRVLVTHDQNTMTAHAYDRMRAGLPMPGLAVIPQSVPIGAAIDWLLLLLSAARPEDTRDKIVHV